MKSQKYRDLRVLEQKLEAELTVKQFFIKIQIYAKCFIKCHNEIFSSRETHRISICEYILKARHWTTKTKLTEAATQICFRDYTLLLNARE